MINLLPPEEEKKIKEERRKKIAIIFSFLFLFFILILGIMLFSLNVYLSQRVSLYERKLESEHSLNQEGTGEIREKVKGANQKLSELKRYYSRERDYSVLLEKIDNLLPLDIYLNNFSAVLSETEEESLLKVSLSGFALKRDNLFNLKRNLEEEFEEVSFPPANWVQSSDINFSASFKVK